MFAHVPRNGPRAYTGYILQNARKDLGISPVISVITWKSNCQDMIFRKSKTIKRKIINKYKLYTLGQKRNAAYKTYILYGVYFINLSQTICHSLSADSWIMSSWGCPGYHCHRTKLIQQFKATFLSILTSRH